MIALIAVDAAVYAIDKPYSYFVPDGIYVLPGMRVIVPFGRGNRRSEGIVLELKETDGEGLKPIERVLDQEPIMTDAYIRMAAFLRERYFCTFYDAIKAMLPAGLWFDASESFERTDKLSENAKLSQLATDILLAVENHGGCIGRADLKRQFDKASDFDTAIELLLKKKLIRSNFDFTKKVKDKTEQLVSLNVPAEQAMDYAEKHKKTAPVQYSLLKLLCAVGQGSTKELCYLTGATGQTIRRLESLGYVSCQTHDVFRSSMPAYVEPAAHIVLSQEQQAAYDRFSALANSEKPGVGLLYGVTGSGKTSVYIQLIREMLERGKGTIYLVPEIALTPQLIGLLMSHFGDTVAVLHSALRVSERYDAWKKIKQGAARVVIGTRSAVFAPVEDIGLLIVDEEQEHSYKSENSPRYHAREVAIYRGAKENALVLLGSATPSIETMKRAKEGVYSLCRLSNRYNGKKLPQVEIVDMKNEIRCGNGSDISTPLKEAIENNLALGRQSILFLNRRGAGRCMICVECGNVQQCPRCSVSLTYHKVNGRLMCHHCGFSQHAADHCEKCGGHMKIVGTGTQRVEAELRHTFPNIEILRMDADTISASNTHESILKRFQEEKIPVLIGTQMVTKGLNFENVTLVGVLDADMSLYVNHYRAAETTFSMLTQVIGRSGRGSFAGKAIIQTLTPEHTVIQLAAKQDYDAFFELESTLRYLQKSPPFGDLFTVTFSSLFEEAAMSAAYDFRMMLEREGKDFGVQSLGPSPAAVVKVNHIYRYKLTVSCANSRGIRLLLASLLKNFGKNKKYRGVSAYADINSYE